MNKNSKNKTQQKMRMILFSGKKEVYPGIIPFDVSLESIFTNVH